MNSTSPIRVLIVDDDLRLLRDFRELLELESDIEVVGVAVDGELALDLAARLKPDVVITDVRMPRLNGIEATTRIRRALGASCRVLVVTTFDLDEYILDSVRAGASGFLLKDKAVEQLAVAVRTVAAGEGIVSPRATARLMHELVQPTKSPVGDHVLTDREVDVVRLMARGMSNEDIANEAHISRATVKTHVSNIITKLNVESRLQVVVWAYDNGIVTSSRY